MIFCRLFFVVSMFTVLLGEPSRVCKRPQGEEGDVFYEGCSQFTCAKKGRKLKWIESPAIDRCCSYEGVLYPPGQEVARLTTSNNCSQVILLCSSGATMQVEVKDLCQTTPGTNTNTCPLALERIEAMIEEAQTNIEAKVEQVCSTTCTTPAPVTEGLIVKV